MRHIVCDVTSCNLVEVYLFVILFTPHNRHSELINSCTLTKKVAGYFEMKLPEIPQVNAKYSNVLLALLGVPDILDPVSEFLYARL